MKTFCDSGSLPGSLRLYCYDVPGSILTACQHRFENGLGDRLQQTVNGAITTYTLDLNTGLTQVLSDGQREYLYGRGRIAQQSLTAAEGQREYFLGDALGSVRQLVDENGEVTLARDYQPYGGTLSSSGAGTSVYGFTGEAADPSGLVYLRARYYSPATGRFMSRDPWDGDANMPMSYNAWLYEYANPITLTDPSGWYPFPGIPCHLLPPDEQDECRGWSECKSPVPSNSQELNCDQMDGYDRPKVCNTYLALRDHPGWWNNHREGSLTPQRFLGLFLRMEFSDVAKEVSARIQKETTVRNFYYICSGLPGNSCNSKFASDIIHYIAFKKLAVIGGRNLILPRDASSAMIESVWQDKPERYSKAATFEQGFLNPGSWVYGIGNHNVPVDWGNRSMCRSTFYPNDPEKCRDYEKAIDNQTSGIVHLAEDQVYLKQGEHDSFVILTYSQLRNWFPDKFQ